jgi:coproporphyrinogen III oxidase-like Fe-S oxidoreductase
MLSGSSARGRFVSRLVEEVALAAREWRDPRPFDTVYFGGGSP